MAISVASRKAKGRELQQWVCKKISALINLKWGKDEQIASREMGQTGTDIRLIGRAKELFPWSVECKRQESWAVHSWIDQARANQLPGTDWLIIAKRNRKPAVAILDAEVFFNLLQDTKSNNDR